MAQYGFNHNDTFDFQGYRVRTALSPDRMEIRVRMEDMRTNCAIESLIDRDQWHRGQHAVLEGMFREIDRMIESQAYEHGIGVMDSIGSHAHGNPHSHTYNRNMTASAVAMQAEEANIQIEAQRRIFDREVTDKLMPMINLNLNHIPKKKNHTRTLQEILQAETNDWLEEVRA